jgi:uncharacterized surface protein with fasciclin (FAS1) repeats
MSGGKAELKKVEGDPIWVSMKGSDLWVWDESGHSAAITISNVTQSNGVIHVINGVLLPK